MMASPNPLPPPTNPKRSKRCEKKSRLSNPGALNLPEAPKEPEAPKARYGKVKVMPITRIKPKIMGLVLHGGRIQFFLHGTYSAVMGDGQDGCQPNPCITSARALPLHPC